MENPRLPDGFAHEKLFVLPEYWAGELSNHELTRSLYVSDIGFFPHAKYHYRERPEGCDAHIFIYCLEGEGWFELEGSASTVKERCLAILPAGVPHRYGASSGNPWSIYWFHLRGERALDYMRLYGLSSGLVPLPIGISSELAEEIEKCYTLLHDKFYSLPAQVLVGQAIGRLLGMLGMSAGGTERDRKRGGDLERAIRFMNNRLADSLKLSDLAAHTGISKQHLIYLFNRETGFPPVEYFLRLKMQRAGQLLSLTGLTVKEIAASVGIRDPYYFSRMFKKRMGVSPTAYRSIPKG